MSNIRAIRTEADYTAALARIDALMDAELGTPEGEELDVLTDLVELYESKHISRGQGAESMTPRERAEQIADNAIVRCGPCGAPLPNQGCGHKINRVLGACTPSANQPELVEAIERAIAEAEAAVWEEAAQWCRAESEKLVGAGFERHDYGYDYYSGMAQGLSIAAAAIRALKGEAKK